MELKKEKPNYSKLNIEKWHSPFSVGYISLSQKIFNWFTNVVVVTVIIVSLCSSSIIEKRILNKKLLSMPGIVRIVSKLLLVMLSMKIAVQ